MGIFDKFFKKEVQQVTQRKEAPKVMFNKLNAYASKSNRKYKDYAKEGYEENAIVHRCIQLIANSASAVKIDIYDGDNLLENHELISLLNRPNPLQSGVEFFSSLYSYLMISGNTYIVRDSDALRPARELYLLRPDRMRVNAGESMIPDAYEYVVDGRV